MLGLQPEDTGPSPGRAKNAEPSGQTGITTTTTSRPTFDGSVAGATSGITLPSAEVGGAGFARFKFCAKASRAEREFGCEHLPEKLNDAGEPTGIHNHHTTVKPIALNRYLAGLILPPAHCAPRRLLVPYSGVGSEVIGALRAGWDYVTGIELEDGSEDRDNYTEISEARIKRWLQVQPDLDEGEAIAEANAAPEVDKRQASLFGDL